MKKPGYIKKKLVMCILMMILISGSSQSQNHPATVPKEKRKNYDPELKHPDGYGGGYNLTPLGCLLYGPWQRRDGYNETWYLNEKEISSKGYDTPDTLKNLVFELQRNGAVHYWYKWDYEKHLASKDSGWEAQGVKYTTHFRPGVDEIKKMSKAGNWATDFKNSNLYINFNTTDLHPITACYDQLGSSNMSLQQVSYVDTVYSGRKVRLKKVVNSFYDHPWNNEPFGVIN